MHYQGVRIIQSYQVENPAYGYTITQAFKSYRQLYQVIGKDPKSTDLIISPEGHRSEGGTLQKGEEGIKNLAQKLFPCILLPIGIVYPDGFDPKTIRDSLNFNCRISLVICQPISYEEDFSQVKPYEEIMRNLALILPPEMRGFWAEKTS